MAEALPRGADHEVVAVAHEVLARVGLRLRPKVVVVRDDAVVDVLKHLQRVLGPQSCSVPA
jgi:hypothetical protein